MSTAKLHTFAVFSLRGFGQFENTLRVGVFSEQLEDALIRTANSRRALMLNRGWRSPLTARLSRDVTKLSIGAYSSKDVR